MVRDRMGTALGICVVAPNSNFVVAFSFPNGPQFHSTLAV
jgi:hypothetical protein